MIFRTPFLLLSIFLCTTMCTFAEEDLSSAIGFVNLREVLSEYKRSLDFKNKNLEILGIHEDEYNKHKIDSMKSILTDIISAINEVASQQGLDLVLKKPELNDLLETAKPTIEKEEAPGESSSDLTRAFLTDQCFYKKNGTDLSKKVMGQRDAFRAGFVKQRRVRF